MLDERISAIDFPSDVRGLRPHIHLHADSNRENRKRRTHHDEDALENALVHHTATGGANGHTHAATHLVGDIRPQQFRHRIDTPSLRRVNVQRLSGSQRAKRSVEDFTDLEQRAAYFDGDPVIKTQKGVNILDRGSQVHFMAEVQLGTKPRRESKPREDNE